MLEGIIVKNISNHYDVNCNGVIYTCIPRGLFRNKKITPLVGDTCIIDAEHNYILEINERKNKLERPPVANVDYALVVVSLKQPDFSSLLLDKEIASLEKSKIKPIIILTKLDLLNEQEKKEFTQIFQYYTKIGYPVFDNQHINDFLLYVKNKIVVLTGQSGAGKSTLLNLIDENLHLQTNEISYALNRGKHTTRHTEIYQSHNIWFVDTPGFSSLDILGMEEKQIKDLFIEFSKYSCKFKDCLHYKEKECMVKKAVENQEILESRYQNYLKIVGSVKNESSHIFSKK